jgi:hypothetical protein
VIVAFAFDTLGYSKRLREAGIADKQAEAHAEAARDFIMTELVTKSDLLGVKLDLESRLFATRNDLQAAIEKSSLQMTLRLGGIVAVGIGILAALQRMH